MSFAKAVSSTKLPPNSPESEQGVLGCCIQSNDCIDDCQAKIGSATKPFYSLQNQMIWEAMVKMRDTNNRIDVITLMEWLKKSGSLDMVGGVAYLSQLEDAVPSAANLPSYLESLVEHQLARTLLDTCVKFEGEAYTNKGGINALLDRFEEKALAIRPIAMSGGDSMAHTTSEAIVDIEKLFNSQGKISGISTGLKSLDRKTDGLKGSELTVIAAYPAGGKSSLSMNIVESVCIDQGLPVGVFNLEMSRKELVKRMISSRARVNLREVAWGRMSEMDFQNMTIAAAAIAKSKLFIDDDVGVSIGQIRAKARRMVQRHKVKLIIVDYIQLASAPDAEGRVNEIDAVSKGCKHMAKEFDIPVIALSQLNDDGKLKGARAIGEDADNVWVLEPEKDSQVVKLWIRKQRSGESNTAVDLQFVREYTKFQDMPQISNEDIPHGHKN